MNSSCGLKRSKKGDELQTLVQGTFLLVLLKNQEMFVYFISDHLILVFVSNITHDVLHMLYVTRFI